MFFLLGFQGAIAQSAEGLPVLQALGNNQVSIFEGWAFPQQTYTSDAYNNEYKSGGISASSDRPVVVESSGITFPKGASGGKGFIVLRTAGTTANVYVQTEPIRTSNILFSGSQYFNNAWTSPAIEINRSAIRVNDEITVEGSGASTQIYVKGMDSSSNIIENLPDGRLKTSTDGKVTFTVTENMYNSIGDGGKLLIYGYDGNITSITVALENKVYFNTDGNNVEIGNYVPGGWSSNTLGATHDRRLYIGASSNIRIKSIKFVPDFKSVMTVSSGYDKDAFRGSVPSGVITFEVKPNMSLQGNKTIELYKSGGTTPVHTYSVSDESTFATAPFYQQLNHITLNETVDGLSAGEYTFKLGEGTTLKCTQYESYVIPSGTELGKITVVEMPTTLQAVPGEYTWSGTEHFGSNKTYTAAETLIDGGYLRINATTVEKNRTTTVTDGILYFNNPAPNLGVDIKIPGPGIVKVLAKANPGTLKINSPGGNTSEDVINGDTWVWRKREFNQIDSDTEIKISWVGGAGSAAIKEIQYIPKSVNSITVAGQSLPVEIGTYEYTIQIENPTETKYVEAVDVNGVTHRVAIPSGANYETKDISFTVENVYGNSYTYTIHVQLAGLIPLTDTYKWVKGAEPGSKNFGVYRTYQASASDPQPLYVVDPDHHLQLVPTHDSRYRNIIVNENGLYFDMPNGAYAKFIVPDAGLIRVKAKLGSNESNYAYIDIDEGGDAKSYQYSYRDSETTKVYMYEYEDNKEVPVKLRFLGGSGKEPLIESIEYVKIAKLDESRYQGLNQTENWSSYTYWPDRDNANRGEKEYSTIINNNSNTMRIIADDNHKIKLYNDGNNNGNEGYLFMAESSLEDLVGYLEVSTHTPGKLEVWARHINDGGSGVVKVSGGQIPKARDVAFTNDPGGGTGAPAYVLNYINDDDTRSTFIGGSAGVLITMVRWTPTEAKDDDHTQLRPVSDDINHPTTWAKWNNYGGFAIKADDVNSTDIKVNILNPGQNDLDPDRHTLMIYGEDMGDDAARTNFSKSGILTLGASPVNKDGNDDHFMEFKVKSKGVLKITAAGNGPNGRIIRAGLSLAATPLIMEEAAKPSHQSNSNNQEHPGDIERHQHDSNHTFYCYFDGEGTDGTDANAVSIFIFGRGGTCYQEITWYPQVDIATCPGVAAETSGGWGGELNPEGALMICEKNDDEAPVVRAQRRLYINQNRTGYEGKVYSSWTNANPAAGTNTPYKTFTDGYYEMYANVNTGSRHVTLENMTPVWKTSQDGRGGFREHYVAEVIKEDLRDGFLNPYQWPGNMEKLVSKPFKIKPMTKSIAASADASKYDNSTKAKSDHPGFGIVYVIAGTQEGNRWADSRIEIAGPASGLDVVTQASTDDVEYNGQTYTVYKVNAVKDKQSSLVVNPFLTYVDLNVGGNNGEDVRIKVDNPEVTWYESNPDGTPIATGVDPKLTIDNVTPSLVVNEADEYKSVTDLSTLRFTPTKTGKTYITARIWGVEQLSSSYRWKEYLQTFEIELLENGLYLERIVPYGKESGDKGVDNVSVADPIVFRAYGAIEQKSDGKVYLTGGASEIEVVDLNSSSYVAANGTSLPLYVGGSGGYVEVPLKLKVDNGNIYFVYDVVDALKFIDEHLWYSTTQLAKFSYLDEGDENFYHSGSNVKHGPFGNIYKYLGGSFFGLSDRDNSVIKGESDANGNKHTRYDFKFTTENYKIGSTLETFIYNVSQRTNDAIASDMVTGAGKALFKNELITDNNFTYGTKKPWYCNWRSYIKLDRDKIDVPAASDNGRVMTLDAKSGATITITPYNNQIATYAPAGSGNKTERKGMIKQIEINFLPTYNATTDADKNEGYVQFFRDKDGTNKVGGDFTIDADNNYTAICTFDPDGDIDRPTIANLTREAQIKIFPTKNTYLKIDQLKVTYYSGEETDRQVKMLFDDYYESKPGDPNDWSKVVTEGIDVETTRSLIEHGYYDSEDMRESNIKMAFMDDDTRHFMLRERWSRSADDVEGGTGYSMYRGEKVDRRTDPVDGRTTLIMRDNMTLPCRFYFYTKDNVAEISEIEFICEDDDVVVESNLTSGAGGSGTEQVTVEGANVSMEFNKGWNVTGNDDVAYSPAEASSTLSATVDCGSNLTPQTNPRKECGGECMLTEFKAGNAIANNESQCTDANAVKFTVTPKNGAAFKPTMLKFNAARIGTDGCNLYVDVKCGGTTKRVASKVQPNRNNVSSLTFDLDGFSATSGDVECTIYATNLTAGKSFGISDFSLTGELTCQHQYVPSFVSYEDDETGGNLKTPRNLYCTSDPRYNPTKANTFVGYPLEVVRTKPGTTNRYHLNDGTRVHKLVYRPESPVNFAFFTGDPNEEGFLFIRQIIVHYDKNARDAAYELVNPNVNESEFTSNNIIQVGLDTKGLKLSMPKVNDVETYTIKRTSTRTNISAERVLDEGNSIVNEAAVVGKYEMPTLRDLDDSQFTNYLHRKFYTLRILDHNRMVMRQLGFRTCDQSLPKISRYYPSIRDWVQNTELHAEEPITILTGDNDIKIERVSEGAHDHKKDHQLIIWTDDSSAPNVEFAPDGRKVTSIHGYVSVGDVEINSSDYLGDDKKKSVVFKAVSLSLNLEDIQTASGIGIYSTSPGTHPIDLNATNASDLLNKINADGVGTFGETTDITRANYVYANATTHYVRARRDPNAANKLSVALNETDPVELSGDWVTKFPGEAPGTLYLNDLYSMKPTTPVTLDDKFHAGYHTSVKDGSRELVKMNYGGYELYAQKKYEDLAITSEDDYEPAFPGETHKADRFRRDILKNDYWRVAQNDLTPYRGLPGVVGGDAYLISDLAPLNEKATYYKEENVQGSIGHDVGILAEDMSKTNPRRAFTGEFDFSKHNQMDTQHDKLWNLPCYGDYFQYEPKANGKLTVYVKQQGVMEQKENGTLDDKLIRFRPVFILDEAGNTPADIKASTKSKISGDWMTMSHTKNVDSKYLNGVGQSALYNMCDAWINENTVNRADNGTGDALYKKDIDGNTICDSNGDPVLDIEYGDRAYYEQGVIACYGTNDAAVKATGSNQAGRPFVYPGSFETNMETLLGTTRTCPVTTFEDGKDASDYANGFMLISEGYVKYEFNVRAGKTYFVFAANGNLGLCSYSFDENTDAALKGTSESNGGTFVIGDNDTNDTNMKELLANNGKTVNVVLERSFKDGIWSSLVLPFSVSKKQLREAFGDGVKVAHFDELKDNHLRLRRHAHQMVVAGTPIFIKPTKTVSSISFNNVTVEDVKTDVADPVLGCHLSKDKVDNLNTNFSGYVCVGSYTKATAGNHSWYLRASDGLFAIREKGSFTIKGTRAWINYYENVSPVVQSSFAMMSCAAYLAESETNGAQSGGITTDTEEFFLDDAAKLDGNVYNLKGQLVRRGVENLDNLPQGVYIINGVKHVVR